MNLILLGTLKFMGFDAKELIVELAKHQNAFSFIIKDTAVYF